jgi:hypothetical protein
MQFSFLSLIVVVSPAFRVDFNVTSTHVSLENRQDHIVENFIIVWLDDNINESDADFQYPLAQLRCVVDSIKTFVHVDPCIDHLTDIKDERVLMIVSDVLGQQLLAFIEDIPQIYSIYVLCSQTTEHGQLIQDYEKVKGVLSQYANVSPEMFNGSTSTWHRLASFLKHLSLT